MLSASLTAPSSGLRLDLTMTVPGLVRVMAAVKQVSASGLRQTPPESATRVISCWCRCRSIWRAAVAASVDISLCSRTAAQRSPRATARVSSGAALARNAGGDGVALRALRTLRQSLDPRRLPISALNSGLAPAGSSQNHSSADRPSRAAEPKSPTIQPARSEEHTSELQSRRDLVCRLLL